MKNLDEKSRFQDTCNFNVEYFKLVVTLVVTLVVRFPSGNWRSF